MLHILLQAQIAKESNKFDIIDTIKGINGKLIKRHPHVFGNKKKIIAFRPKKIGRHKNTPKKIENLA